MKLFLVISLTIGLAFGSPPADVEIIKQRLVRFPEEPIVQQTTQQADETRRILDEINKINMALGYVKKQDEHKHHHHQQGATLLDSNTYLFPKPPSAPIEWKEAPTFQSTIRRIFPPFSQYQYQAPVARKIIHQHSLMIPQPFNTQAYYYPEPYLRAPFRENPRIFKPNNSEIGNFAPNLMAVSNDITSIVEYAKNLETEAVDFTAASNEEFERKLLNNVHRIVGEANEKQAKSTKEDQEKLTAAEKVENRENSNIKYIAVPAKVRPLKGIVVTRRPAVTTAETTPQRPAKPHTQFQPVVLNSTHIAQLKTHFGGLLKPQFPLFLRRTTTTPPPRLPLPSQNLDNNDDDDSDDNDPDYEDDESYLDSYHTNQKGIFQQALDNQKEVLKSGGVLIQKLRVRKGGIAIAGPGGVATAGSGGTAIIGPGGVALTHPRSLTIAGPGARIVALPADYDLEKAILKTSARSLPPEGVVVATGPTIYYSP